MNHRIINGRGGVPSILSMRKLILKITRAHGGRDVRVFGSFARNEQTRTSDIDLLVELPERATLLDQAGLMIDLEKALKRKVDLITYAGISPYLRERILSEATPL